jgi:hypothetical protein
MPDPSTDQALGPQENSNETIRQQDLPTFYNIRYREAPVPFPREGRLRGSGLTSLQSECYNAPCLARIFRRPVLPPATPQIAQGKLDCRR